MVIICDIDEVQETSLPVSEIHKEEGDKEKEMGDHVGLDKSNHFKVVIRFQLNFPIFQNLIY